ncbi:MAG: branched chain amino acid aminotransferase [Acidobacteria bacterium RIFCSPLOWO2_02_FULL_67_36]|nr:MAG: branched chain amino acid aminotransferase [Acidobacteria bacterium RIFCSPLOWO2_02_FULL_67_36]OFW22162.1 MAG: branched chain amino acid aminotransferase [Acidobacteria bacterium RIFCSPLOWO2_12_FULL_66_21]
MAFTGTGKIWMNGSLVDWADAKIHIASHVIHYGSGIFEGARCYSTPRGSACFRLDTHMRRLFDSAKIYRMAPELDLPALTDAVLDTIRANEYRACYIRPIVYRGYQALGVNPFPCPVDTAILLWEWGAYLGQDALEKGVDVRISSWSRAAPNTFPTLAKTSANYANSGLIKMEAVLEGYSEGIALDSFGYLSEGSGQNLFVVRENVLYTPPITAAILPGITRSSVITLARDLGFRVREEMLPREMLYIADEAFFAGTAVEITPIRSVDKIPIGGGRRGPITEGIQRAFFDIINGEAPDRHGWLTYVYPGEPLHAAAAGAQAAQAK